MKAGIKTADLVRAFRTSEVKEVYDGLIGVTNLKPTFGTSGDIWVVRGDRAPNVPNAKSFVYKRLFERVEKDLHANPDYAVFDGTGASSMPALRFYAQQIGRESVVVIAREFPRTHLPPGVSKWRDMKIVRARGQAEKGYLRQMITELQTRKKIIPLRQAEFGAWAMAPVGNWVVQWFKQHGILPDAFVSVMASGATFYGIGRVIANNFPSVETTVVIKHSTFNSADLKNKDKVREFARKGLVWYLTSTPDLPITDVDAMAFPLHLHGASFALLRVWEETGEPGIDHVVQATRADTMRVQARLRAAGYDWTDTTAFALVEAIRLAEEGKNVVAMVYGKGKD